MKELNCQEVKSVSGGFWMIAVRFIVPTVVNMIAYSLTKKHKHEEITPQGLAIAGGAGIAGASIGVAGGLAAGGTLIGNAVWAPSAIAINASGNAIAQQH